jgi:PAS domain S-box-containing protein
MSIKQKLLVVVASMVAAILAVGVASLHHAESRQRATLDLEKRLVPALLATRDVQRAFRQYAHAAEVALSIGEPRLIHDHRRDLDAAMSGLATLAQLDAAAYSAVAATLRADLATLRGSIEVFADLAAAGVEHDQILAASEARVAIGARLDELVDVAERAFAAQVQRNLEVHERDALLTLLAVGSIALAAGLTAFLLVLSILRRMRRLQSHFASADLNALRPLEDDHGGDELGVLIRTANGMMESFHRSRSAQTDKAFVDQVLATMTDMLVVTDAMGCVVRANSVTATVTGLDEQRLQGRPVSDVFRETTPASAPLMERLALHRACAFEATLTRDDGRVVPLLVAAALMQDKDGSISGSVLSIRDVSELRAIEAQRRKMEAQLLQASKLASLGTLGAGVAHELNNPLVAVKGFAEMLLTKNVGLTPEGRVMAEKIIRAAERMRRITDHLRRFSADTTASPPKVVALKSLVEDSLILLEQRLRVANIELRLSLDATPAHVLGDANQLESIFQNLFSNSLDAFKSVARGQARTIRVWTELVQGDTVELHYEDNAGGIPEAFRERIFDPFFTTKDAGVGTGLGLSICHDIARKHGGHLSLTPSTPGTAHFTLRLPRVTTTGQTGEAGPTVQSCEWRPPAAAGGKRLPRLLLVDDESSVLEIMCMFLEAAFEIVATTDPSSALETLRTESFAGVITDMRMPKISGLDVLKTAKQRSPELPVIIMTGHAKTEAEIAEALALGAAHVIPKPFPPPSEVLRAVEAVINDRGAARKSA